MTNTVDNLILDMLEWLDRTDRTYAETMDAWRTSCPRLTVWEDANERGLIEVSTAGSAVIIRPSTAGRVLLSSERG